MRKQDECYDEWWLHSDMDNMGYIFEYCHEYCMELFNTDIDIKMFLNAFMRSKCREEMETGHPRLLSQSGKDTVEMFINIDNNGDAGVFVSEEPNDVFAFNQLYWVGWMYAYLHFKEKISSKRLIECLPLDVMLNLYYTGHEVDVEVFRDKVQEAFTNLA